jgi:PAS domain S-box-containing protein
MLEHLRELPIRRRTPRRPYGRLRKLTIGARITAIALIIAVPLNLVNIAVIWHLSDAASEAQRSSLLYTARSVAAAVDAKLSQYMTLAQSLASSPALLEDKLDTFEIEARRVLASTPDALVVVANSEGRQIAHTVRRPDQALAIRDSVGLATERRAFETRSTVISGVHMGAISRLWVINVEVPVFKNGQPFRTLAVAVKAESFFRLLNAQHIPRNWLAAIIDGKGRYIARVPDNETDVGQLTSEGSRSVKGKEGVFEFLSFDGEPIASAHALSAVSEWVAAVAVKKTEMQAAAWDASRWALMLGGGFLVLSLLLAGAIARSIIDPIAELREKAAALSTGPLPTMPLKCPPEVSDLWRALEQSAADRDRGEQALRESDEKLRLALDAAKLGIWRWDAAEGTEEMQWDSRCRALFGVAADVPVTYGVWANSVVSEDRARIEGNVARALDPADPNDETLCEYRVCHPDGRVLWLFSTGRAFFEPEPGSPAGRKALFMAGAIRDVTEVHSAEVALRESEERFRGIFENAATGIAIMDLEGRFQSCNPAYAAMLGYTQEELRKLVCADLIHADDRGANSLQQNRLLAGEIPSFEIVSRYFSKERTVLWGHRHMSLLRDAENRPTHIIALVTDITKHKEHEDQIRLLMREVNHRSKNLLSVVHGVARQTIAANPEDFLERFEMRIAALAASQDLLVKNEWKGVDLEELVRSQLAHFEDLIGTRITLQGPPLFISASAAQAIGMALHELATNAGKHGALAGGAGRAIVQWRIKRTGAAEEIFLMDWQELCTHSIPVPSKRGFGSTMICKIVEMKLDAKADLEFPSTGLTWRLQCPASHILEGSRTTFVKTKEKPMACKPGVSTRPRILVVEDEAIVALEMASVLVKAGFEVVGPARSVNQALDLLNEPGCDAAVLDINLGTETSESIAHRLKGIGTGFVSVSGYSREQHPAVFRSAAALTKPLQAELLIAELKKCLTASAWSGLS